MELDGATGEGFYVKRLAGESILSFREDFEQLEKTGEVQIADALDMMAKLIILSACDAHGNCLFTQEDFSFIRAKNMNLLVHICNIAMPLSGMVLTGLDVGVAVDLKKRPTLLFYYRLANQLGKSVEEIKALPASEIAGWVEYVNIFGWDDDRADWRIAQLDELTNQVAKGQVRKYGLMEILHV